MPAMNEISKKSEVFRNLLFYIHDDKNYDSTEDSDIGREDSTVWYNYRHFVSDNLWEQDEKHGDLTLSDYGQNLFSSWHALYFPNFPGHGWAEQEALSWNFEPQNLKNLFSEFRKISTVGLYNRMAVPKPDGPTWDEVLEALESFRHLDEGWDGFEAPMPKESSLQAAIVIARENRDTLGCPRVSIDGDGDIAWTWEITEATIFLTIEKGRMHLLCKNVDGSRFAFDNVPVKGYNIPEAILKLLPKIG